MTIKLCVASVVSAAIMCGIALLVGCATTPQVMPPTLHDVDELLARGDDRRAFSTLSRVLTTTPVQAEAALAKLRGSPRLLAAMEVVLKDVLRESAIRWQGAGDRFEASYASQPEVQTYFRLKNATAAEQRDFLALASVEARALFDKEAREEAEEERRRAEAARLRADEQAAARAREEAELRALLLEADRGSRVTCSSDNECRKAFALAQIYVSTMSDMKIQLATDTIIETYNPTDAGKMGAKVIKTPGAGQSAEIVITVSCRDCSRDLRRVSYSLMAGFRPFIEGRLRQ